MESKTVAPDVQAEIDRIRAEARAAFAEELRSAARIGGDYIDRLAEAAVLGGRPVERGMHRGMREVVRELVADAEYQVRHGRRAAA